MSWILMRREEITRWRCVHQSALDQEKKVMGWTEQGKFNIKKQSVWLMKNWLTRSKENSKQYRISRPKGQPLPKPSTEMENPWTPSLHPRFEIEKKFTLMTCWMAEKLLQWKYWKYTLLGAGGRIFTRRHGTEVTC